MNNKFGINIDTKLDGKVAEKSVDSLNENIIEPMGDIIRPAAKNIGNIIGDLLEIAGITINHGKSKLQMLYNYKLKLYQSKLEEKINSIPQDKKTEPDIDVLLNALEDSKNRFTNDDIREMFVNLISNSMNSDTKEFVHPAFSNIIKQLDSNDAVILKTFVDNSYQTLGGIEYCSDLKSDTVKRSVCNLVRLGLLAYNNSDMNNMIEIIDRELGMRMNGYSTPNTNFNEPDGLVLTEFGIDFVKICCE